MGAGHVLIVGERLELCNQISAFMLSDGFIRTDFAQSANEARRKINLITPDLVIIIAPLSDEAGADFIIDIAEKTDAGIIVLVNKEILAEMQYKTEYVGALILPKPISKIILKQTAHFALNSRKSIKGLKDERNDLKKRMDERKTVETAKWVLVEKLNLTEPQAHRYIQKRAMDSRLPQLSVAEEIIKDYE